MRRRLQAAGLIGLVLKSGSANSKDGDAAGPIAKRSLAYRLASGNAEAACKMSHPPPLTPPPGLATASQRRFVDGHAAAFPILALGQPRRQGARIEGRDTRLLLGGASRCGCSLPRDRARA